MGVCCSNHSFTWVMLYSEVMTGCPLVRLREARAFVIYAKIYISYVMYRE